MKVIAIVAASINNVIGVDGNLPWNSPSDLANFQKETMGHDILMGRKTWESLPRTPKGRLPGRKKHVLSRCGVGCGGANGIWKDIGRAVAELRRKAASKGKDKIFIIGGAEVFRQALELDLIDEIWLTRMFVKVEDAPGTVYFPQEMLTGWPLWVGPAVLTYAGPNHTSECYTNPKHYIDKSKEEPEMIGANAELEKVNSIIANQQELLAEVVKCYVNDKPVPFQLAQDCAAYCNENWDIKAQQPQADKGPSPLAAEVASTVGEQLKAAVFGGGGVFKIENLTINVGK